MIDFLKENFYIGFWYVYPPSDEHCQKHPNISKNDWIACLWREPSGKVQIRYRWLYYDPNDNHGHDSEDRRSWQAYESTEDVDPEGAKGTLALMAQMNAVRNNSEVDYVEIYGDGDEAVRLLREKPWFHETPIHEMN